MEADAKQEQFNTISTVKQHTITLSYSSQAITSVACHWSWLQEAVVADTTPHNLHHNQTDLDWPLCNGTRASFQQTQTPFWTKFKNQKKFQKLFNFSFRLGDWYLGKIHK